MSTNSQSTPSDLPILAISLVRASRSPMPNSTPSPAAIAARISAPFMPVSPDPSPAHRARHPAIDQAPARLASDARREHEDGFSRKQLCATPSPLPFD